MLVASGVPLLQALQIVKRLSSWPGLDGVIDDVVQGRTVSQALDGFLPPVAISSLRGAEVSGGLEEALLRLSIYYEARAEVEEKIRNALVYPCFILIVCLLTVCLLIFFVLPGFKSFFVDLNTELPWLTRAMLRLGELASSGWYWPLGLISFLTVVAPRLDRRGRLGRLWRSALMRSRVYRRTLIASFFMSLSALLDGGIAISEALKTAAEACPERDFAAHVLRLKEQVEAGQQFSAALTGDPLFADAAVQMVSVGEATGQLSAMLRAAAEVYDREGQLLIKRSLPCLSRA